jgi:enamine deaminase RidA (YjgF/YER057c/UK114 family)
MTVADREGRVEGSLATQTERAMLDLVLALEAAGVALEHLVKLSTLVVDWSEMRMNDLLEGLLAAAQVHPVPAVPITLHGVSGLFLDAMLVEVEGIAVLPPGSERDPEPAAQW